MTNIPRLIARVGASTALAVSSLAAAQPAPVQAHVPPVPVSVSHRLELRQDACYVWGIPAVTIDGTRIAVTQSVTPLVGCTNGQTQTVPVTLGILPLGNYRLTYTPVPVGFGPLPVSTVEFDVGRFSTGRRFTIEPAFPSAFEPLTMVFDYIESCETIAGFRPIAGGFRVELAGRLDFIYCDSVTVDRLSIGAYPPGTYRIELANTDASGGEALGTLDVVVRPGGTGMSRFDAGGEDFLGVVVQPERGALDRNDLRALDSARRSRRLVEHTDRDLVSLRR